MGAEFHLRFSYSSAIYSAIKYANLASQVLNSNIYSYLGNWGNQKNNKNLLKAPKKIIFAHETFL